MAGYHWRTQEAKAWNGVVEHVPGTCLRDVTASQRDGHRTGVRGRSSHDRTRQSLGASGRLPHPQHRLTVTTIALTILHHQLGCLDCQFLPELDMGPFCKIQSNPIQQLNDPVQSMITPCILTHIQSNPLYKLSLK